MHPQKSHYYCDYLRFKINLLFPPLKTGNNLRKLCSSQGGTSPILSSFVINTDHGKGRIFLHVSVVKSPHGRTSGEQGLMKITEQLKRVWPCSSVNPTLWRCRQPQSKIKCRLGYITKLLCQIAKKERKKGKKP